MYSQLHYRLRLWFYNPLIRLGGWLKLRVTDPIKAYYSRDGDNWRLYWTIFAAFVILTCLGVFIGIPFAATVPYPGDSGTTESGVTNLTRAAVQLHQNGTDALQGSFFPAIVHRKVIEPASSSIEIVIPSVSHHKPVESTTTTVDEVGTTREQRIPRLGRLNLPTTIQPRLTSAAAKSHQLWSLPAARSFYGRAIRLFPSLSHGKDVESTFSRYPVTITSPAGLNSALPPVRRGEIISPTPTQLLQNTIGFGVAATAFFCIRMLNALWAVRKMHLEDWLMIPTFLCFLSLYIVINVSASYQTNLIPPDELPAVLANPSEVHNRIIGSIMVIPLEQSMLFCIWGVKTCIWLFLKRLCRQLPLFEKALMFILFYMWAGFIMIEITYFCIVCRPFTEYWALPVKDLQCATYQHYSVVQMAFNISSDLLLVAIPLLIFWISRIPRSRKIMLSAVFSLAFFTILAAILNKYYNWAAPFTTAYQLWYIRESGVAMCVGNIINCWQLIQKVFNLKSFNGNGTQTPQPIISERINVSAHPVQYDEDNIHSYYG